MPEAGREMVGFAEEERVSGTAQTPKRKKDGAGGPVIGSNTISGQLRFLPKPPPPRIGLKSINTPWTDLGGSGQGHAAP